MRSICRAPSWWWATARRGAAGARLSAGRVPRRQAGRGTGPAYASADVFVFPSRTDTFGLVLLEALASGVPVAAFPAAAPRDVIGEAPVGVIDEDFGAPASPRSTARARRARFALRMTWDASARIFLDHVAQGNRVMRTRRPWLKKRRAAVNPEKPTMAKRLARKAHAGGR